MLCSAYTNERNAMTSKGTRQDRDYKHRLIRTLMAIEHKATGKVQVPGMRNGRISPTAMDKLPEQWRKALGE